MSSKFEDKNQPGACTKVTEALEGAQGALDPPLIGHGCGRMWSSDIWDTSVTPCISMHGGKESSNKGEQRKVAQRPSSLNRDFER